MRYIIIFVLLLLISWTSVGQQKISASFSNEPVISVIQKLESETGKRFFFNESWIDSLSVTETFDGADLEVVLNTIFNETSISYYQMDDRIILTDNVVIISQPEITNSFSKEEVEVNSIKKGLVFSREYSDFNNDESNLENTVFEIGNRNSMVTGGESTIAGYIRNAETNEPIEGALVYVQNPFIASSTDANGFYSMTLPNGKYELFVQYVGMRTTHRNIVLFSNGKFDVEMQVDVIALQEVLVESDRDINISNVQMGVSKLNVEETKNIPIVLGERDIMKVATTLAGVQTVGEGASGYNVRGGKADQNLIMINNAPIYNASHFFGFFSVFNSEAIEDFEVYKSGIPARYGGRLSSVFDIQSKSANKERFAGEGGISPITGKLILEVPIIKNKTSLLVSGRTTYSNWLLKRSKNAEFNGNEVSFYDLSMQLDHEINEKNSLIASAYYSNDKFKLASDTLFSFSDFNYQNSNATLKWKHQFNQNFDMRVSAIYAGYEYDLSFGASPSNSFVQDFGINEKSFDVELNYFLGRQHTLNFGGGTKHYLVNPGTKFPFGDESIIAAEVIQEERGLESHLYVSDQYEVSDDLLFYLGLRYSMFNTFGPQDVFSYSEGLPKNNANRLDSTRYGKGDLISTYHGPEVRFSGRYKLDDQSSVKFSYSRTRQYIHALSNSASLSPTDTWRISNSHLLPQVADQFSLGYYRNFLRNRLEASVETYYKTLDNLVDFKVGSEFLLNRFIEQAVLQGPGKSYGVELSIQKKGKLNGWINYAYARTFIKLDGNFSEEIINRGNYFPTAYDKPHTFNLVANYKLTRRFSCSINATYNTGRPVTVPESIYSFMGFENLNYSDRNQYRIPDYFRVDLGLNLEGNHKVSKLSHSFWSLSIYNLLGRDNPYSVFFDVKNGKANGYQLIIFGNPIPTLSYNFKF